MSPTTEGNPEAAPRPSWPSSPERPARGLAAVAFAAAAAAGISAFVGAAEAPSVGILVVGGLAALGGFLLGLLRPDTGVWAFVLVSPYFYAPQLVTGGLPVREIQSMKDVFWVSLVAGWALRRFVARVPGVSRLERDQPHQIVAAFFLGYAAVQVLRVVPDPSSPRAWGIGLLGFREYAEFLPALFILPDVVPDARALRRLLGAFVATSSVCLAYGAGQAFLGWPIIRTELDAGLEVPPTSFLGEKYAFAFFLQVSALLLYTFALERGRPFGRRAALLLLALAMVLGIGLSQSKISLVTLPVTFLVFGLLERDRLVSIFGPLLVVGLPLLLAEMREGFAAFFRLHAIADPGRVWVWERAQEAFLANPAFGSGYGQFGGFFFLGGGLVSYDPHSGYLALLGTLGLCGLGLFLLLVALLFREGRRVVATSGERRLGHSFLALFVGQLLAGFYHDVWVNVFPVTFYFWAFPALLFCPAVRGDRDSTA